jgi:uncharacterized protein (TIGR00290 family)
MRGTAAHKLSVPTDTGRRFGRERFLRATWAIVDTALKHQDIGCMKTWLCWSGGKDSAYALEVARSLAGLEIVGLLTTLSAEFDRISMHGVRRELLEQQADVLGLPVEKIFLPTPPRDAQCRMSAVASGFTVFASNDSYETAMLAAFQRAKDSGVRGIVFGDIYLEDLRRYREMLLARAGLQGIFPLWGRDSRELVSQIIDGGIRSTIVCVDSNRLDRRFCGRELDHAFVTELPRDADPCGERGEYHTFVHEAPAFRRPIAFSKGEWVWRKPFWFCDLAPAGAPTLLAKTG